MNRVTADGERIDRVRSRLEVLPPVPSVTAESPELEAVADSPPEESASPTHEPRKKRRLKKDPLPDTGAASNRAPAPSDTVVGLASSISDTQVDPRIRKPLPLATLEVAAPEGPVEQPIDHALEAVPAQLTDNELNGSQQLEAIHTWHEAVEAAPVSLMDRVSRFMSGWATSFVFHMLLLIGLALLTFGAPDRAGVMLSLANVDSETLDAETVEIQVDFDAVLDSATSELEDEIVEDLATEDLNETLDADQMEQNLEDFGISTLAGEGVSSKMGGGGDLSRDAQGKTGIAGESVDFFGAYAKGQRFIFVIDCSGSMSGERWRRARYELTRSIDALGKDQQFCVILYNSFTKVMMDSQFVQLVKANEENKVAVKRWLKGQVPDGGTYPQRAMTMALAQSPDAIFLLSDGEIQDNTYEFLLANNKNNGPQAAEYDKIPVHTIALLSTFGQRLLKAIAEDNDGTFTRVGRR